MFVTLQYRVKCTILNPLQFCLISNKEDTVEGFYVKTCLILPISFCHMNARSVLIEKPKLKDINYQIENGKY